jgi:hypothetical protein
MAVPPAAAGPVDYTPVGPANLEEACASLLAELAPADAIASNVDVCNVTDAAEPPSPCLLPEALEALAFPLETPYEVAEAVLYCVEQALILADDLPRARAEYDAQLLTADVAAVVGQIVSTVSTRSAAQTVRRRLQEQRNAVLEEMEDLITDALPHTLAAAEALAEEQRVADAAAMEESEKLAAGRLGADIPPGLQPGDLVTRYSRDVRVLADRFAEIATMGDALLESIDQARELEPAVQTLTELAIRTQGKLAAAKANASRRARRLKVLKADGAAFVAHSPSYQQSPRAAALASSPPPGPPSLSDVAVLTSPARHTGRGGLTPDFSALPSTVTSRRVSLGAHTPTRASRIPGASVSPSGANASRFLRNGISSPAGGRRASGAAITPATTGTKPSPHRRAAPAHTIVPGSPAITASSSTPHSARQFVRQLRSMNQAYHSAISPAGAGFSLASPVAASPAPSRLPNVYLGQPDTQPVSETETMHTFVRPVTPPIPVAQASPGPALAAAHAAVTRMTEILDEAESWSVPLPSNPDIESDGDDMALIATPVAQLPGNDASMRLFAASSQQDLAAAAPLDEADGPLIGSFMPVPFQRESASEAAVPVPAPVPPVEMCIANNLEAPAAEPSAQAEPSEPDQDTDVLSEPQLEPEPEPETALGPTASPAAVGAADALVAELRALPEDCDACHVRGRAVKVSTVASLSLTDIVSAEGLLGEQLFDKAMFVRWALATAASSPPALEPDQLAASHVDADTDADADAQPAEEEADVAFAISRHLASSAIEAALDTVSPRGNAKAPSKTVPVPAAAQTAYKDSQGLWASRLGQLLIADGLRAGADSIGYEELQGWALRLGDPVSRLSLAGTAEEPAAIGNDELGLLALLCPRLRELDISHSFVTEDGLFELLDGCAVLSTLVAVGCEEVSESVVHSLVEVIPHLKVVR